MVDKLLPTLSYFHAEEWPWEDEKPVHSEKCNTHHVFSLPLYLEIFWIKKYYQCILIKVEVSSLTWNPLRFQKEHTSLVKTIE
jgi:hypothetical protein